LKLEQNVSVLFYDFKPLFHYDTKHLAKASSRCNHQPEWSVLRQMQGFRRWNMWCYGGSRW